MNLLFSLAFKSLVKTAHSYIKNESSLIELNALVQECLRMNITNLSPEIVKVIKEWEIMINRCWNEWGYEKSSISKEEFLQWLRNQILIKSS